MVTSKSCKIVSGLNLMCAVLGAACHDNIWFANFIMAVGCWYISKLLEKVEEQEKKNV